MQSATPFAEMHLTQSKTFGQKTFGQHTFGQHTFGHQTFGCQTFGQQTFGQQTFLWHLVNAIFDQHTITMSFGRQSIIR
jgi:hypothetical protein